MEVLAVVVILFGSFIGAAALTQSGEE